MKLLNTGTILFISLLANSCGHMIGPLFYKKNSCGPYKTEEVDTAEFINRANSITIRESIGSCSIIERFQCMDYQTYSLKAYDLAATAIEVNGNAIYIEKKWQSTDGIHLDRTYNIYEGVILKCN